MIEPVPKPPLDDFAPPDDALIGRAFRWSVFVLVLLAAGGGAVWYSKTRSNRQSVQITPLVPPALPERLAAEIPRVQFTDITTNAGITFVHQNGAQGDKLLPETMGGGVAFFDFDNDGDQDLFFVNSTL